VTQQGRALSVLAPAKLNLLLNVLRRRPDRFHDLETVMLSVRLFDTLEFHPVADDRLELLPTALTAQTPDFPLDQRNLILRAADRLRETVGIRQGVRVVLTKRIPSEAGLGGGSSDAAATLVGLNRFWKLGLPQKELHRLAAELGSDVNFFLDSVPAALCSGRGERIQPWSVGNALHFVIVKPPVGLSTGKVFEQWGRIRQPNSTPAPMIDAAPDTVSNTVSKSNTVSNTAPDPAQAPSAAAAQARLSQLKSALGAGSVAQVACCMSNDLEPPARSLCPEIHQVLTSLQGTSSGAAMTGSGSACFLLCRSAGHARSLAGRFRQMQFGQVWTVSSGV